MCGRFALTVPINKIAEYFQALNLCMLTESFNISPGSEIAALINDNGKKIVPLKWGLVPSWAKDPLIGNRMINARAETLAEKPAFRNALKKRRCLIITDGFYEWKKDGSEKTPYFIRKRDGSLFTFAGLAESWMNKNGTVLNTCTIITTGSNELLSGIHDRMPVILQDEAGAGWIDMSVSAGDLLGLLMPYQYDDLEAFEVSHLVNSPLNNSPQCIAPV